MQNIFDDDVFFKEYCRIRENEFSYNALIEQPACRELLPDFQGKTILDLGCGFGLNCVDFVNRGAKKVIGIDISEKMLNIAKTQNHHQKIEYIRMSIEDVDSLETEFDLIYSSLAMHYIKDFNILAVKLYALLNKSGILLFSQEHPLVTAPLQATPWIKDEHGNKAAQTISDYMNSGERKTSWIVDGVTKYHRPLSEIANTLIENGFRLLRVVEPVPSAYALEKAPHLYDEFIRPTSIIIKAGK